MTACILLLSGLAWAGKHQSTAYVQTPTQALLREITAGRGYVSFTPDQRDQWDWPRRQLR